MPALNPRQVGRRMKEIPSWAARSRVIRRTFEFAGFLNAVAFVNRVAKRAERKDHHPDIDVRWNKVTLALSTHSEGGLTDKDFEMALGCEAIYLKHFAPRGKGAAGRRISPKAPTPGRRPPDRRRSASRSSTG